jgi:membrane protein
MARFKAAARDLFHEQGAVWRGETAPSRLYRLVHFWLLVGRSFVRNRCLVRASALAYTTLLALIPLLAVGLSVTTSLLQKEGEKPIQQLVEKLVANVAPALDLEIKGEGTAAGSKRAEVVAKITSIIANIRSGALGITGMIALVFVAISLLRTIEATFNDIWGVTRGRGWIPSIIRYWTVVTLGPVVLVVAIALTSGPHFETTKLLLDSIPLFGRLLFHLLPFGLVSLAFALFYQLMPNTAVQWRAALAGGIVGGCLWEINNIFNTIYVSRVVTYSKIYGSLGIIPVFLVGLYFSWLILLLGAQVAYAYQNRAAYLQEKQAESINQRGREFIAWRLMARVARNFARGQGPVAGTALATGLGVPSRLASQLLAALVQAKLLVEVAEGEMAYQPARPLDQITLKDITVALRIGQGHEPATADDPLRAIVRDEFNRIQQVEQAAAGAVTLADLVNREPGP